MSQFEDYAQRIVEKLPEAQAVPKNEDGSIDSTLWERHKIVDGSLIPIEYRDTAILTSVVDNHDKFADSIIDRILRTRLDENDRDLIVNGIWGSGVESLAFYKSYHFINQQPYSEKWGIFIYDFGVKSVAEDIENYYPGKFSSKECVKKALRFLHRHERYHWHIDAWTMSHEAIQNVPLYENYLNFVYRTVFPSCAYEEALANNHAYRSLQREGITDFMNDFMSQQPGAYCKYSQNPMELRSRVATQILDGFYGKGLTSISGYPNRPDQAPWVAQGSKSLLWDGNCPVFLINKVRPSMIIPPNIGAPGFKENHNFITRYLSGKPDNATDHEYYRIDNGEKIKLPNQHGNIDRLKRGEFDNIIHKAGMRLPEYRNERIRTKFWKKNIPRAVPKKSIVGENV